jgi:hypothetical protein
MMLTMKSHSKALKMNRYNNLRSECLDDAMDLLTGDRNIDYGEPIENFERVAAGWSIILGKYIAPHQVALCMTWLKIARLTETPDHKDSYTDAAGYIALGWELVNKQDDCS